jgi:acid phosphatase type 7
MLVSINRAALGLTAAVTAAAGAAFIACDHAPTAPRTQLSSARRKFTSDTGVTFVGAGDIAGCGRYYEDEATAALVKSVGGAVFALGDNAYPDGSSDNYVCYNASWGAFKKRTRPAPGNHEYRTSEAAPYFGYFGALAGPSGKGYYSFNLGAWHVISLNSQRDIATQTTWLKSDLAAHPAKCTLAYWHHPLFTSGNTYPPYTPVQPWFKALYNAGADVVISAHDHNYERFAPQLPTGVADAGRGIREFVIGLGGHPAFSTFSAPKPNSQVRYAGGHGVLKLRLFADHYSWTFISVPGKSFKDSGTGKCH